MQRELQTVATFDMDTAILVRWPYSSYNSMLKGLHAHTGIGSNPLIGCGQGHPLQCPRQ